jgi:hypothetical protein
MTISFSLEPKPPFRLDLMGAAKATQQRGGSVGWSNVSPGVDAEWQTLRR